MWRGAKAASIQVPPHIFHRDIAAFNLCVEFVKTFLTHATTNNLANLWEEYIGTLYGAVVLVNLHIEGFNILWIVRHNDWFAKVLLH